MAAKTGVRSKSKDRNLFIALGVAALIVIAAIYYEAPSVVSGQHTSASSAIAAYDYPTEYGNADNWAYSADPGMPASNASVLAENGFNSYPIQATPFLAGGASRQVALGGFSYIANVGNYELYGMNIETQNEIYDVSLPNAPITALPYATPFFHLEVTTAIGSQPEVWVSTPWDGIYAFPSVGAVNANYGFNMTAPQEGQDGNKGTFSYAAPNFVIDQPRSIMVAGLNVNTTGVPGRGFVEGWKLGTSNATLSFSQTQITVKSATSIWTDYLSPPQDGSDPGWELNQVNSIPHVWEFNGTAAVDLRTLPASTMQSILSNDWTTQSGANSFSAGPDSNSSWVADTATDTTYISTSAPQTVSLTSSFNGPALFSSSIIALNTTTGSILWTFQVTPHDVWGWGCPGNIALVPATIGGTSEQVIAKQCNNGYLYLLDPATGALLYSGQVPGVVRAPGAQIPNILDKTQMSESLSTVTGANATSKPVSVVGTNIAYDPTNSFLIGAVGPQSDPLGGGAPLGANWNSTAYAFDLTALAFHWQAPVPNQEFSYIMTANGIAYMGTYQGQIIVANAQSGSQLKDILAAMTVTSIIVMNGVHGQTGLVVSGSSIETKEIIQTELYTPAGVSIVP